MLLLKKITILFDHQYLLKETSHVLDFSHRDSIQEKMICKATAGWVWPCVPSHLQTLRLTRGELDWSGCGMGPLEVIQNEKLIEF